jgi:hypothetical protein
LRGALQPLNNNARVRTQRKSERRGNIKQESAE